MENWALCVQYSFNPFQPNVLIMEKPGGSFLLALTITHWPTSLLKMPLFHMCLPHFASKNQLPGLHSWQVDWKWVNLPKLSIRNLEFTYFSQIISWIFPAQSMWTKNVNWMYLRRSEDVASRTSPERLMYFNLRPVYGDTSNSSFWTTVIYHEIFSGFYEVTGQH